MSLGVEKEHESVHSRDDRGKQGRVSPRRQERTAELRSIVDAGKNSRPFVPSLCLPDLPILLPLCHSVFLSEAKNPFLISENRPFGRCAPSG